MSESYTNVKRRKVGGQAKRPKILKPLIGVSLFMLLLACYTILRSNAGAPQEEPTPVDQYGSLSELEDPDRFMQAYLDSNGGLDNLKSFQTMRINGVFQQNDSEVEIFMLKRRPDMALTTYRQGQVEVTHGHAEGRFWVRSSAPDNAPVVREMSEEEKVQMRTSLPMFGPVLSVYLDQQGRIESIQAADYKDKKLLQLELVSEPGRPAEKVFVDPDTMTIVSKYSTGLDGQERLTEFFDYRSIRGAMIPYRILTSNAGSGGSTIEIKSVSFNVGASSSLFRAPDLE